MKTLAIFVEPAGAQVTMRTAPDQDVLTYVVFVRKWTSGGDLPETTWFPDQLESAAGASLTLGAERGYDLVLKASVRPGSQAVLQVDIAITDAAGTTWRQPVTLPSAEGPVVERLWAIVIR